MYTAGITAQAAQAPEAQILIGLLTGTGQQGQRKRAGFIDRDRPPQGLDENFENNPMHRRS
jgi:hypothetical protein